MKPGNPYAADCPTRLILDRVGDKWAVLLLGLLRDEPMRFNALRRGLAPVTPKALKQTLTRLERNGLVSRRILPGSPPGVEYAWTPLAHSLEEPLRAMAMWAAGNVLAVEQAQRRFDADAAADWRGADDPLG